MNEVWDKEKSRKLEEANREHSIKVNAAYHLLVSHITKQYDDLAKNNPRLVELAKAYAGSGMYGAEKDGLYYDHPVSSLPVVAVDGKYYPAVSYIFTGMVPLWALYLPKAREAIELMEGLSK
jgi:hypothetical protein